MEPYLPYLAFLGGLVVLVWSADKFVEGAVDIAKGYGLSPLLVGMVIVGFGTSAPELTVSALAALNDNPGLALGNAYGSNIANIALILGMTILIKPVGIERSIMTRELPILLGVTFASLLLLYDGFLSYSDGAIMLLIFTGVMYYSIKKGFSELPQKNNQTQTIQENSTVQNDSNIIDIENLSMKTAIFWTLAGIALLIVSSRILIWGAVEIATDFGISDVIVGLTIVAIGTSLPELAATIAAVRKNEHSLVMGNIIGSNLFNTLAVVGIAGVLHPIDVPQDFIKRDIGLVIALTGMLWFFGYTAQKRKDKKLTRYQGFILATLYTLYTFYLVNLILGRTVYSY